MLAGRLPHRPARASSALVIGACVAAAGGAGRLGAGLNRRRSGREATRGGAHHLREAPMALSADPCLNQLICGRVWVQGRGGD